MDRIMTSLGCSRALRFLFWAAWAALWFGGLYGCFVGARVLAANVHLESYGAKLAVMLYFTFGFGCGLLALAGAVCLLFWLAVARKVESGRFRRWRMASWIALGGFIPLLLLASLTALGVNRPRPQPSEEALGVALPNLAQRWNGRKLVVLGLDGLSWKLLRPLMEEGRLPQFKRLCDQGAFGVLETLSPTLSPPIWTTMVTGKYPEQHGVLDFTERTFFPLPYFIRVLPTGLGLNRLYLTLSRFGLADRSLVTRRARRTKALWNIFDDAGMHSVVVGWWASWPAETIRGVVVTDHVNVARMSAYRELGMKATSSPATSFVGDVAPIDLLPELLPLLQDPQLLSASDILRFARLNEKELRAVADAAHYSRDNRYSIIKFELATDLTNYRLGRKLFEDSPWDAFFLYLPGLDGFQHHFYQFRFPSEFKSVDPDELRKYGESINAYYVFLDGLLVEMLEGLDDNTYVLIVSDHGIEANPDYSPGEGRGYNQYASGIHTETAPGVFILSGPGVRRNHELRGASLIDITPSILALLGLPVGDDMPGRVLSELLSPEAAEGFAAERIPTHDLGYSPEISGSAAAADPRLLDRLRALGYFD